MPTRFDHEIKTLPNPPTKVLSLHITQDNITRHICTLIFANYASSINRPEFTLCLNVENLTHFANTSDKKTLALIEKLFFPTPFHSPYNIFHCFTANQLDDVITLKFKTTKQEDIYDLSSENSDPQVWYRDLGALQLIKHVFAAIVNELKSDQIANHGSLFILYDEIKPVMKLIAAHHLGYNMDTITPEQLGLVTALLDRNNKVQSSVHMINILDMYIIRPTIKQTTNPDDQEEEEIKKSYRPLL